LKKNDPSADLEVFRDLLGRWSSWVHAANLGALGYSQSRYSEYVGSGSYADPVDDIDPDVLSWDAYYKNHLPNSLRDVIHLHWLAPGRVKQKHKRNGNQAYYARKMACEEAAMEMWRRFRDESRAIVSPHDRATTS
jgi:hypothetical protein